MTFLAQLRQARRSAPVVRQKFRLVYNPDSKDVYAFFESTDDIVFYLYRIKERVSPQSAVHTFVCDGKAGVIGALKFAQRFGKTINSMFFVDRDLDDFDSTQVDPSERLFLTEHYSIENYLCTKEGFDVIWCEFIKLPVSHPLYKPSLRRVIKGLDELGKLLLPAFSWVIERRRAKVKVIFGSIGPGLSGCFNIVDLKPIPNGVKPLRFFMDKCLEEPDCSKQADVRLAQAELKALPRKRWLRGKFELWYFVSACNQIWTELVKQPISAKKRVKKTMNIDQENIFALLANKILMPDGLGQFIESCIS